MSKIIVLSGHPAEVSRLSGLLDIAEGWLREAGVAVERVHIASLPAEDLVRANFESLEVKRVHARIEEADGVLIASPVYKASFTGILKAYLDLLPQRALAGKVITPLFVGGTLAHFLSIDHGLKPILSALGARHILTGVYALDSWITRDEEGQVHLSEELSQRLQESLVEFTDELSWRAVRKQKA